MQDIFFFGGVVPSASPELNLAENAQGYLKELVKERIRNGEVEWRGNAKKKMAVLEEEIEQLNKKKSYWRALFADNAPRCREVVEKKGNIISR